MLEFQTQVCIYVCFRCWLIEVLVLSVISTFYRRSVELRILKSLTAVTWLR